MKESNKAITSQLEDGVDRISSLPDPILHMILSGLPTTEEVIRTSILATRWRYLWTLIPSIDIDCWRCKEFDKKKFKKFVYHALENSSLDLKSFSLDCRDHYNMATIRLWVRAAFKRNIKKLDLSFCCGDYRFDTIKLPNFLFTCSSLEVLRFYLYQRRLTLPKIIGFSSIRVFELDSVDFYNAYSFKKFLESCPLLEDLSLINCIIFRLKVLCISCPTLKNLRLDNRSSWDFQKMFDKNTLCGCIKIDCPKLVYFEFGAFKAKKYKWNSLDTLKEAVIHPEKFSRQFTDSIFAGIFHVESLSTSIEIFRHSLCPSVDLPSLPNIKTLKITTGEYSYTPTVGIFITFLTRLPNLESLHLIIEEKYFCWEDWKLDEAKTRSILTCHLKRVEFLNFYEEKLLLDLARSLLEHSTELEEMVFRWKCDEAKFHERSMETMKEVSKFHKASSTVKLITLNKISCYPLSGKP